MLSYKISKALAPFKVIYASRKSGTDIKLGEGEEGFVNILEFNFGSNICIADCTWLFLKLIMDLDVKFYIVLRY